MRLIKMFGLAAVAAVAAMAFLGAGSASATVLCEEEAAAGPCEAPYASGTAISASSTEAVLKTSLGTVICKKSATSGKTTAESGKPLPGKVESLTFNECALGSTSCTATAVHLPYTASVEWTSGNNGSFLVGTGTGGAPGARVICGTLIDCTFTGEGILLDANGGAPGTIVAKEETLAREAGGLFCPSTSTWTATYTVSAPNPVFVAGS